MTLRTGSFNKCLELNGFRAWICCDGEPLPVYQVTSVDNQTTRCHTASQAGKELQVQVQLVEPSLSQHDAFTARLFTDGYERTRQGAPRYETMKLRNVRTSSDCKQPLMFSPIETTDDTNSTSEVDPDEVGLIEIRVWWAEQIPEQRTAATRKQDGPTRIHERSETGGFNVATLGAPIYDKKQLPKHKHTMHSRIGNYDNPVAVLRFYHQPLAMLQAAGIVPILQSASSNPPPADPPTRKRRSSLNTNAEAGPSKKTKLQTGSQDRDDSDEDEDVRPLPKPSSRLPKRHPVTKSTRPENSPSVRPLDSSNSDQHKPHRPHEGVRVTKSTPPDVVEDVRPPLAHSYTSAVDRAAQLEAQIAAREIRVKRLVEEEQLAAEKAELAQLRAQAHASQRKGKGKERDGMSGIGEFIDLTIDD